MASDPDDRRVAIVTGASRALGREIARGLVALGYRVVTCSRAETGPGVGESLHVRADVQDPADATRCVNDVLARFHRIDALVNNAGYVAGPVSLGDSSVEDAQRTFATNVLGPTYFVRAGVAALRAAPGGGVVVNIASRAAISPIPGLATYSASKSALVALTLAVAKENSDGRLFLAAICPGGINTEMRARLFGPDDARQQLPVERVAAVAVEVVAQRTAEGKRFASGSAVLVTRDGGVTVEEWAPDPRGHASLAWRDVTKG